MNKRILKWNFIFQYGWVLTNIFNSLLLLPFYLSHIDSNTLGVWLAASSIMGWMILVDPGVGDVLQQRIAEARGKGNQADTMRLIGSGTIASLILLVLSLILGIVFYLLIGHIINKDISAYSHLPAALCVSVAATGMTLVSFCVSGINQGLHNSAHVAICSLSANFLFLFVNLGFLFAGYGVLSIAIANLCRAVYINIFNIGSLSRLLKREGIRLVYEWDHFLRFIRIFSLTSVSKIITGLSYSMDMIVLARYISPAAITMYEINKRPINTGYSLIGRHSVALMPLISYANGSGDKTAIMQLIARQFRFYCYAALLASMLFIFNYENLVTAWVGKQQYAGSTVINLLVAGFFFSLISYFIAVVGYALGDIRMNSIYNIIRNIFFGLLMFFAARRYGIVGTVVVAVSVTLVADLSFYTWRLYKLGYWDGAIWKRFFSRWLLIVPVCFLGEQVIAVMMNRYIPANMYLVRVLFNGGLFTLLFTTIVLLVDESQRQIAKTIINYGKAYCNASGERWRPIRTRMAGMLRKAR